MGNQSKEHGVVGRSVGIIVFNNFKKTFDKTKKLYKLLNMKNANWILNIGTQKIECSSFPFAFRTMHDMIAKGVETKRPVSTSTLSIQGPPMGSRQERTTYSYYSATELARSQNLLLANGTLNSKEFKR